MVLLRGFDTGPCEVFLKLESHNPGGSIKDRIGLSMIDAAERAGLVGPDQPRLVEATAGNTGLGLALVAAQRGYRLTLVIPDKMSTEKILHLKALGAAIVLTRSDVGKGHPDYYQDLAERLAAEQGAFYVNQFSNPANPAAHERTTGPEIVAQSAGRLDAMVVGVGSGGTITGLSRHFANAMPSCEMVLADPEGSVLAGYVENGTIGEAGSWLVEGIGEDFLPSICDLSRVRRAYSIPDRESLETARSLLRQAGILAGSSSGTLLAATLRYCREQDRPKRVCTLVCDSGNKYLSKMFSQDWLADEGLWDRPRFGDLRDIVARWHEDRAVVTVRPDETLQVACARMRMFNVSQLPVVETDSLIGIVDESDILHGTIDDPSAFGRPVRDAMTSQVRTIERTAPIEEAVALIDAGLVPVVVDRGALVGLLTPLDLVNHLRRAARGR